MFEIKVIKYLTGKTVLKKLDILVSQKSTLSHSCKIYQDVKFKLHYIFTAKTRFRWKAALLVAFINYLVKRAFLKLMVWKVVWKECIPLWKKHRLEASSFFVFLGCSKNPHPQPTCTAQIRNLISTAYISLAICVAHLRELQQNNTLYFCSRPTSFIFYWTSRENELNAIWVFSVKLRSVNNINNIVHHLIYSWSNLHYYNIQFRNTSFIWTIKYVQFQNQNSFYKDKRAYFL